jgi:hypothetical protein
MKEPVGSCRRCGKTVYCDNGFLEGVVLNEGGVICLECDEKERTQSKDKE